MKLYKARNGNLDRSGKALYVFVVAGSEEEAERLAKEAFSHHPGLPSERGAYIRMVAKRLFRQPFGLFFAACDDKNVQSFA